MQSISLRSSDLVTICKLVLTPSTVEVTLTLPTTTHRASTTCSPTDGTSKSLMTMVLEKSLKTLLPQIRWDTTHMQQTILSQETELLLTLVVKVVSLHGIVTTTVIRMDLDTQDPLTDTCITCGVTGLKVQHNTFPTQDTITTLTSSDSAGVKSMKIPILRMDPTHTTTGVTTTTPTTAVKVSTSLLKATPDTVDTTTSVWITLTVTT
ncbi:MAG: Uncharacterised protein [Euryarchaeota archaeon UBA443]|nr:MAG: Uncharacterised protein [Euryarchaeota archaeon UBA443]